MMGRKKQGEQSWTFSIIFLKGLWEVGNASVMTVDFRVRCGTRNLQVRRRSDIHSAVMDCELERNDREPPRFNEEEKYKNRNCMEEG
jgi:hypothetical protein